MTESVDFIIDARCLQAPAYRERGVGRHSANLVKLARRFVAPDSRLIALVDPLEEALSARHAALFDAMRSTAYSGALNRRTWFVELSALSHDPLFVASLVNHPEIFTSAVVYDFIPDDFPDRYLADPNNRLKYALAKFWLSKYDAFFPISQVSARRLSELIGPPPDRITVTGASMNPAFEKSIHSDAAAVRHVLCIGGNDPRKNVECVIRAHAMSGSLQHREVPLLITGAYPSTLEASFQALYQDAGGTAALLRFPGHVEDKVLVSLYREAICLVVPSYAEGFSLPVVEAMAVGTPVIASRIPAHQELIPSDDFLFDPEDSNRVAQLIQALEGDPEFRRTTIADQAGSWERFRPVEVAHAFWSALISAAERHEYRPPATVWRGRKPKVAVLTPLPPDRSGVADFMAASLRELGRLVDVHVFTETPSPKQIDGTVAIHKLTTLPFISGEFDRIIGVVGNSGFHERILRYLLRFGGACVQHDSRLFGLYAWVWGRSHTKQLAESELGRSISDGELDLWFSDESNLEATLLGELADIAEPLCLHSKITIEIVRKRFHVDPAFLPVGLYRPWQKEQLTYQERIAARLRLGISDDEVAVMSFGFVNRSKCPEDGIWALYLLRAWNIPAKLYIVGDVDAGAPQLFELCQALDIIEHVKFARAYISETSYRDFLLAADAGLQIRSHLLGGTSGALLDCISVGLPTVSNEDLAAAMEAPSYVQRVPDRHSPVLIAEALVRAIHLASDRSKFEEERQAYSKAHDFANYARVLCDALSLS